jgi:hypothetical protein
MAEDAGTPRTLEALRAELAAASAQVALAAATAVDPWDEVSGDEDDDEAEDGAAERGAEPTEGGESSPDDGTPRSIYDAAEQVDAVGAEGGLERSYSDPSVASVLDPLGALEKPDGQIKTLLDFCTHQSSRQAPLCCICICSLASARSTECLSCVRLGAASAGSDGSASPHTTPQAFAAAAGDPWAGLAAAPAAAVDLDLNLTLPPTPGLASSVLPAPEPQLVPVSITQQSTPGSVPKKKKKRTHTHAVSPLIHCTRASEL